MNNIDIFKKFQVSRWRLSSTRKIREYYIYSKASCNLTRFMHMKGNGVLLLGMYLPER